MAKKQDALDALVDEALDIYVKRIKLQHEVDALKAQEEELKDAITLKLHREKKDIAQGARGEVEIRRLTVAQVTDEDAFLKWGVKPANRDAVKIGVVGEAYRRLLAEGVKVPGVHPFTKESLTIRKRK